jgi:hypothetical protein
MDENALRSMTDLRGDFEVEVESRRPDRPAGFPLVCEEINAASE